MGEYITLDGQDFKLGTCEDLYYIRHADLTAAVKAGRTSYRPGNAQPAGYLEPGWRFRFPFPDEDGKAPGTYEDFDRGLLIGVPVDYYGPDFEHYQIGHTISARGGGYQVGASNPCPASPAWVQSGRKAPETYGFFPLEIVRQKTMEGGEVWPVCRCGWCGSMFRLDYEEASKLCAVIEKGYIANEKEEHRRTYWAEVCRRLLAGFALPEPAGLVLQ